MSLLSRLRNERRFPDRLRLLFIPWFRLRIRQRFTEMFEAQILRGRRKR